ncbi:MAG: S41 family peptidase [Cyanobacteria bacterium P01_F01_bin.42]
MASARDLEVRVNLKNSPKAIVDEAWQVVHRNYVDQSFNQVNWLKARETLLDQDYTTRQQAYAAIRKALQPLDDPYTRFMDPKQFKSLTRQTSGELMGIGIMLLNDAATGQPVILKVVSDSPAEKAGLKAGDAILKVGDRSTDKLAAAEVAKLLRGEAKSVVKIQLKRKKQLMSVAIVRDLIQLQAVSYKIKKESSNRIGYIQVSEFSRHTSKQMQKAINELTLAEVDAFVLDLRGNPGGLLDSSIEIAQMWINRGLIVRTVDRSGQPAKFYARRKALTDLPLAVLVNQSSASSSEILTGALKDNKRATVIGTKTFGKALVQAVHQLADGSGLAVTVAQYYTPNGTDISRTGITPDIQISMPTAQALRLKNNQRLRTSNVDQPYQQAVRVLNRQLRKSKQSYNFFRKPSGPIDFSVPDQQWGVQS